jgi:hypothetical protein
MGLGLMDVAAGEKSPAAQEWETPDERARARSGR